MNSNIINIALPAKGRLREKSLEIFKKKKLQIHSERGERDLFGYVKNHPEIKIIYLHAREAIESLSQGNIDIAISGYDLLKESEANIQRNIIINKRLNFGRADLVLAISDLWIDVQTLLDLDEVAYEFKKKKGRLIRISTKYPALTQAFLYSKGISQFQILRSLGSTEAAVQAGIAEVISDITSSGATLKANNLRILKDGLILKTEACLMSSKLSLKKKGINKIINLLKK